MKAVQYIFLFLFLLVSIAHAIPFSEETPNTNAKPRDDDIDDAGDNDLKDDDKDEDFDTAFEEVSTISTPTLSDFAVPSLPTISVHSFSHPTQSPFVDDLPHPTESRRMDPRFANPRSCAADQYLCRKASPDQEHIRCIPNEWKCNGVRECEENDDELDCPNNNAQRPLIYLSDCPAHKYKCQGTDYTGHPICIDTARVCDGQKDCPYEDDENGCDRHRPSYSRAPEIKPDYPEMVYKAPTSYQTNPSSDCPKPKYSEVEVEKMNWRIGCMKNCFAKHLNY